MYDYKTAEILRENPSGMLRSLSVAIYVARVYTVLYALVLGTAIAFWAVGIPVSGLLLLCVLYLMLFAVGFFLLEVDLTRKLRRFYGSK